MDKTLEDECQRLPDEWREYFGEGYKPGSDDDHTCWITNDELRAEKRRAVEMAIRRAATACRERAAFFDLHGSSFLAHEGDECAAAILKLLD
jgi:hypothetical protein